jgi:hypothetical protein
MPGAWPGEGEKVMNARQKLIKEGETTSSSSEIYYEINDAYESTVWVAGDLYATRWDKNTLLIYVGNIKGKFTYSVILQKYVQDDMVQVWIADEIKSDGPEVSAAAEFMGLSHAELRIAFFDTKICKEEKC